MSYKDTKVVINSITYDDHSNNILKGVRKHQEHEDSQTAEVVLNNSDKRFTDLNLKGLTAVISYDFGSGFVASPTVTVITQDDITSNGNYQTVLTMVGIPDLLAEDKASKDYVHDATDTKTIKALLTEVLDGVAVESEVTATQDTVDGYYNLYTGDKIIVGQSVYIPKRTVKSIQFRLKKVGNPTGDITFYMRPTDYSWTESKVLSDASALSTSPAWKTATLDTEKYVDDEVYIYCEYQGGDGPTYDNAGNLLTTGNYVAIGYSKTAVASDEWLGIQYADTKWMPYSDQDCGYKYTYDIAGIDCFSHCTSVSVDITNDSLIDVYTPGSDFKISEGDSRLDVVDWLLSLTGCVRRVQNDDKVYIFPPTTTGTTYANEFTTEVGNNFYANAKRKTLIVPNKIVVKSANYENDAIIGSATSAASYALLPITGVPIRKRVDDSTQADDLAAAKISQLEWAAQVGSASVPMYRYSQIWDYTYIDNKWQGDTNTGNIAYINRVSMGGRFEQFFSFGRQSKRGIAGTKAKREVKSEQAINDAVMLNYGMIRPSFEIIDEMTDDLYEKINVIFLALQKIGVKVEFQDRGVTFEWVYSTLLQFMTDYYSLGEIVPRWQVTERMRIPYWGAVLR